MSRYFIIFSLLATAALAQDLGTAEQKALIQQLQAHRAEYPAMTGEFTEEKTTRLLTKPLISTGDIAFEAPDKFRRELRGNSPSTTVCNGKELWIYYPKFKEAEHYTLGQQAQFDDSLAALTAGLNFADVDQYFRLTASKDGTGHRIVLTPRKSTLKRILTTFTVWFDDKGTLQKTDATLPKGDRIITTYRSIRPMKKSTASFDFAPPAGAKVSTPLGK